MFALSNLARILPYIWLLSRHVGFRKTLWRRPYRSVSLVPTLGLLPIMGLVFTSPTGNCICPFPVRPLRIQAISGVAKPLFWRRGYWGANLPTSAWPSSVEPPCSGDRYVEHRQLTWQASLIASTVFLLVHYLRNSHRRDYLGTYLDKFHRSQFGNGPNFGFLTDL